MDFELELGKQKFKVEVSKTKEGVKIKVNEKEFVFGKETATIPQFLIPQKESLEKEKISAPIPGEVGEIFVKEGERVKKEQKLLTILAMKTENEVLAPKDGTVKKIFVKKGERVQKDQQLIELK